MRTHSLIRAASISLTLLGSASAWATPNFPGAMRSTLELSAEPSCDVCHQGMTSVGTVTTPFGSALRTRGLVLYNEASLRTALEALRSERVDSDGDSVPDTDELVAGTDPNVNELGGGPAPLPDVTYGCGAAPGGALGGLLGGLLLLRGLRRGTRRRVGPNQ